MRTPNINEYTESRSKTTLRWPRSTIMFFVFRSPFAVICASLVPHFPFAIRHFSFVVFRSLFVLICASHFLFAISRSRFSVPLFSTFFMGFKGHFQYVRRRAVIINDL